MTLSPRILTTLLREELGYDGLIVTDGMEMQAVAATYGIERGSVLAVAAYADAICVGGGLADDETVRRLRDALVTAVRTGELPEQRLADAAQRVRALARWTASRSTAAASPDEGAARGRPRRRASRCRTDRRPPGTAPHRRRRLHPARRPAVRRRAHPGREHRRRRRDPVGRGRGAGRLLPGTETGSFAGTDAGHAALVAAGERRIVAVVRDEHRHPWMTAALDTLLTARPDTVVVEMGVPQAPPRGALHIATHGAARVCGRAAAEVIAAGTPA